MPSVILYENTTWEFNFWIGGLDTLAREGAIDSLRFASGSKCPVPSVPGWSSLTFSVVDRSGKSAIAVVDIRDSNEEINLAALERATVYFKLNFNRDRLKERLAPDQLSKVHPLAIWFPVRTATWTEVPEAVVRSFRAAVSSSGPDLGDVSRTLRFNLGGLRLPRLEYFTRILADEPARDFDLFWKTRAWSVELAKASAQRAAVMEALDRVRSSNRFRLLYGFMDTAVARQYYPDRVLETSSSKKDYLRTLSRSKIGIVTRGLRDSLNWGIGEHLAMGRFAFCERPVNTMYQPLVDGKHVVFFESDLSDFEEKIRHYLSHDAEREAIAAEGRRFFDTVCAPEAQARYLLTVVQQEM